MFKRTRLRTLIIALLFSSSIATSLSAAVDTFSRLSDMRYLAMGSAGVALLDSQGAFPVNPAVLFRRDEPLFRISSRYGETFLSQSPPNDPIPWMQEPTAAFEMLFSNRYVGLSIGLGNVLLDRKPDDNELHFSAYNDSRIQLTGSYGWESISMGIWVQGGNRARRDVTVRERSPLFDYITRTYLERYDRQIFDGQSFSSGLGLLISYQWVSIGLMTDSLFSMDYATNALMLDLNETFAQSSVGLALSTPVFDQNDELNRLVINGVFDVHDIGSPDARSIRFGAEGKLQYLGDLWIALRAGYQETRPSSSSIFSFNGDGVLSLGIGGRVGNFGLDLVVEVPLSEDKVALSAGLTWGM